MARTKEEAKAWKEDLLKETEVKLTELTTTEKFKEYLNVVSSFRKYSLDNINLIFTQKPNATVVAGFQSWKKLQRNVQKGAKAIYIKAPMIVKLTEEEKIKLKTTKDTAIKGYKFVPVFDISDTKGKELVLAKDFILNDYSSDENEKMASVKIPQIVEEFKTKYNIDVEFKGLNDKNLGGYYDRKNDSITINLNQTKTEQLKVLFHEFAHSQLHSLDKAKTKHLPPQAHREAQAESVAYLTMKLFNVDTSSSSMGYIATWAKDPEIMKKALSEIKDVFNQTYSIFENINQVENKQENNIQKSLTNYSKEHDMKFENKKEQEQTL